jgi:multiple sugar transport system permease protein
MNKTGGFSLRRHHAHYLRQAGTGMLFVLPSLTGLAVFIVVPFLDAFRRSFMNGMTGEFEGFQYYREIFLNPSFLKALENTGRFIAVCVPVLIALSLMLALMLSGRVAGRSALRASFLVPMAIPVASVALLWQVLFHKSGVMNAMLSQVGFAPIDWMKTPDTWHTIKPDLKTVTTTFSTTDPRVELSHTTFLGYYELHDFIRMMPRNDFSTTTIPEPLQQGTIQWPWDGYINWYDRLAPPKLQYSWYTDREADFWPTLNQVHFEAVPQINSELVFITMSTFTPSFKTYQVKVDDGEWQDSDFRFNWNLHSGKNHLQMRAVSKFGVAGHPSDIEINYVVKYIPKTISFGTMNQ